MKKTLKGNQKRIAAMAPPYDKITQADFIALKKRKSSKKSKKQAKTLDDSEHTLPTVASGTSEI